MEFVPDRQLNPPEPDETSGFNYWICAGCGDKECESEMRRIKTFKNNETLTDENKCVYCIREEIPELLENDEDFTVTRKLGEPDGWEELDEATMEGY